MGMGNKGMGEDLVDVAYTTAAAAVADGKAVAAQADATTGIAAAATAQAAANAAQVDADYASAAAGWYEAETDFALAGTSHPVTVAASLETDAVSPAIVAAHFDDTTAEGVCVLLRGPVPSWAATLTLTTYDRAKTAPPGGGGGKAVARNLWGRPLPDDGTAVPAWSAGYPLTARTVAEGDAAWRTTTQSGITLAQAGLVAGQRGTLLLSRAAGASNLVGDWEVRALRVTWA